MHFKTLFVLVVVNLLCAFAPQAQSATNAVLEIQPPNRLGWFRLNSPEAAGQVLSLYASTNLAQWAPIATFHDGIFGYPDPASESSPLRFYRAISAPRAATNDWKNQALFPQDAFLSQGGVISGPEVRWIKFAIPLQDPVRVYYQDSAPYPFHYDFAKARLEPFRGMTPSQFDQISLHTNQQQVLLGTLIFPPPPNDSEYGIQFVGQDAYSPEMISQFFRLVQSTVAAGTNVTTFYVPTYEQAHAAETNRTYFESQSIRLASADRWVAGDYAYSTGWALGRLKYFPSSQIDAAFADGRLLPEDILLTDAVPAELPVFAGVLSLTPATPNSHVAILSRSYGLPFAYIDNPAERTRVQQLSGKEVLLRVDPYSGNINIIEMADDLDPVLRDEILALKKLPTLEIMPKAKYGAISASTDTLTPADTKYFGGKASNFGFLRRKIPNRSHQAIGLSFDLWDAFLDQVMPGGQTLRAQIQQRLSGYSYPPANIATLKQDLAAIRTIITDSAQLTESQKQAVIAALRIFDPHRNIRFRSSTNVEDSEQFTGAGLYDSFSGCLQDDIDGDNAGPCDCDPSEKKERGVFRAIQKVYASFYNDNAFLERLRRHVNESEVGMALLVHHSTPDDTELANGVATIEVERGGEFDSLAGDLVTQKGAVSITNPDNSAQPEVISGYHHAFGVGGFLKQRSSLVPLGAYVMDWETNYIELMNLFASVADAYHEYFPKKTHFILDFEYKKEAPGVLNVKQVREVPANTSTNLQQAFLINRTNDYCVLQGEAGDVFSNHRLKSFWSFQTKDIKLAKTNLTETFYENIEADYLRNGQISHLTGSPANFPGASHALEDAQVIDRWTVGTAPNLRVYALGTEIVQTVSATTAPVLLLSDFRLNLTVTFATPQPALQFDFNGLKPVTVNSHSVVLEPRRPLTSTNHLQQRNFSGGAVSIQSSFYWPAPPSKGIGEKTAPLVRWKETRISGLASQPITLRGEYSQTYRPGHHNFSEEFIFEPALDEGIGISVVQELRNANIQLLHVFWNGDTASITILGLDGKFRPLQ